MWFNCDSLVFFLGRGLISPTLPSSSCLGINLSNHIFQDLWFLGSAFSRRVSINAWKKDFTPRFRGALVLVWQVYLAMLDPIYRMCSECLGTMTSQLLWFQAQWTVVAVGCKYPLCDYSNVVSFGYNELWRQRTASSLSVISQSELLWPMNENLATKLTTNWTIWSILDIASFRIIQPLVVMEGF